MLRVKLTHLGRYGTPYLLSLELPKELTALVWLAGPLSGTYAIRFTMLSFCRVLTAFLHIAIGLIIQPVNWYRAL